MPERVGPDRVKILADEYVMPVGGDIIAGPQTVQVFEYPEHGLVRVHGTRLVGGTRAVDGQWEVKANSIEDFMAKVRKVPTNR